jgi:hypothetical protein
MKSEGRYSTKIKLDDKHVRSALLRFSIRNTHCDNKQDIGRADEGDNDQLKKLVLGVKNLISKDQAPELYVLITQCVPESIVRDSRIRAVISKTFR